MLRNIHYVTQSIIVAAFLCACSHQSKPSGSSLHANSHSESLPIIDAHIHTDFDGKPEVTSNIPFTFERLLEEQRISGVVGAVSHNPKEGVPTQDLRTHNVIHCAAVVDPIKIPKIRRDLQSGRVGCLKIYLGYVHRYAYDPIYSSAYKLAEQFDVPVVFHTGDTYSEKALLKYADPLTIDEVAVKYPKVRFVIAHIGNPWIQSAAEVAYKNPNVFIEASGVMIGDLSKSKPESIDEFLVKPLRWVFNYVENPKKVMFATDWPLVDLHSYIAAYKKAIPKEHWRAVFYENAKSVFKFKEPQLPEQPQVQPARASK